MISNIVDDYLILQASVSRLLKVSGYRMDFVADKMGMDRTSFYLKRKKNSFAPAEMKLFLEVIGADSFEDKILHEMSIEDAKSETMTEQEVSEWLNEG